MRRTLANGLTALLAMVTVVAPRPPAAAAIAYGEDASDGAYGFSVRLTVTGLPTADGGVRDSWCSGALIAPRWVITAGHCFRDAEGRRVSRTVARRTTATVGRTDLRGGGGQESEVVAVRQAENSDVALAQLRTAVTGVTPLRLATSAPVVGESLRLTGYGLVTDGGDTVAATRLQTGGFVVAAVGDTLIETSGRSPRPETSPCPHDSGGPYFRQRPGAAPELVALVSTGPRCPHRGADLSARTDTLHAWITATMAGPAGGGRLGGGALWILVAGVCLAGLAVLRVSRRRAGGRRR